MRKRRKPYAADLPQPIPVRLGESKFAPKLAALKKLVALCEHYEIPKDDPDKWFLLALALADEGGFFRLKAEKPKWLPTAKTTEDLMLYVALATAELAGKSVNQAAINLTKRAGPFRGRSHEGLRQRYYLLKDFNTPEGERMARFLANVVAKRASKKL